MITLLLFTRCQHKQYNADVPAQTDDGRRLFDQYCVRCHLGNGGGGPSTEVGVNAPDIRQFTRSKADLVEIISNGYGKMPAFGDSIPKEDIPIIASYVATQIEKKASTKPNGLN